MRKISYLVLLLVISGACSPKPVPKDQQPLFGEVPRTEAEKAVHEQLLEKIKVKAGGSEKDAFKLLILAGWKEIEEGRYRPAIKRFNLAWLLEPFNPQVFYGIGSAFAKMEDWGAAYKWNLIAANAGYANAQSNIGWMYLKGLAVEQDAARAAEWYHKAAEQGVLKAQNILGVLYDYGIGVERDEKIAQEWYHRADDAGYDGPWKKFRREYFGKIFHPDLVSFEDVLGMTLDQKDPDKQPA